MNRRGHHFFFSVLLIVFLWGLGDPLAYSRERIFYLDQLDLALVKQGWGAPQKNLSVKKNPIKINGKVYERGIGTHAASELTIVLDGKAKRFKAVAGINDEACERATLSFSVWADGQRKYYSGIVSHKKQKEYGPLSISLELAGVKELSLVVDDGNNRNSCDQASWAEASLELSDENYQPRTVEPAGHRENFEEQLTRYERKQYEPPEWKSPLDAVSFINLPQLESEETFAMWTQVSFLGEDAVISVIFREGKPEQEARLLFYHPFTGKTRRMKMGAARIWALCPGTEPESLLLGVGRNLLLYNIRENRLQENKNFFKKGASDFILKGEKLIVRYGSTLEIHESKTLKLIKSFTLAIDKIQRMIPWEENKVILASTYWGASLRTVNLDNEELSEPQRVRMPFHFHSLLRGVFMPEQKALGLFDMSEKRGFGMLKPYLGSWVFVDKHTQVLPDEKGIRHSPVRFVLEATVNVKAEEAIKESEVNAALMPKEVYNHTLKGEKVLPGSRILLDKLGNRHLVFSLPAMEKGQIFEKKVYQADLTLYTIKIDYRKSHPGPMEVPAELEIYLKDDPWYDLEHPLVVSKFKELSQGKKTVSEIVKAVHLYSQSIPRVERIDPAPVVIEVHGGGCNNHTRVQVALLRKAGIPARFAWNFFGVKDTGGIEGNHWIAEAWLPGLGWIPMEGQGHTYSGDPGEIGAHYLIQRAGHVDVRQYKSHLSSKSPWADDLGAKVSVQWSVRKIE